MHLTVQYIFIMTCLSGNYTPNIANFNAKLIAIESHVCFLKLCIHHVVTCVFPTAWISGCVCVWCSSQMKHAVCYDCFGMVLQGIEGRKAQGPLL